MRSFLTRPRNSLARVVLLAPCLLICLACATPFPVEKLQKDMTTEMVRETFGQPESIQVLSGNTVSGRWCYLTEEQLWPMTFFPLSPLLTLVQLPFAAVLPNVRWDDVYVGKREIVLHFDGEKLVWWGGMDTFGFTRSDLPESDRNQDGVHRGRTEYGPAVVHPDDPYEHRWVRWGAPCDWPQTGGDPDEAEGDERGGGGFGDPLRGLIPPHSVVSDRTRSYRTLRGSPL